jgi:hypothetical protein
MTAEVDEACLVGMQRELVPSKTLAQDVQNPLGILEVRERYHGVVGESDKGTFALQAWLHLILEPLIQQGASSFTVCPSLVISRAPQAPMPTRQVATWQRTPVPLASQLPGDDDRALGSKGEAESVESMTALDELDGAPRGMEVA